MLLAAAGLCMFGDMWELTQAKELEAFRLGWFMRKLFPFKRTFDFNLTHILLFANCILLLSIRPEPVVFAVQEDEDTKVGSSGYEGSSRDRRKKKEIRHQQQQQTED